MSHPKHLQLSLLNGEGAVISDFYVFTLRFDTAKALLELTIKGLKCVL